MEQHKVQGTGLEEDGTTKSSFASKMQQERIDKKIDALFQKDDHEVQEQNDPYQSIDEGLTTDTPMTSFEGVNDQEIMEKRTLTQG